MKSLNSKTDISISINLRYLRLKLLKNKENNKKICHIFNHNFKNIPCYVMNYVSLKGFYFALFDDGLTLKTLKLAFIGFWIQTLHIIICLFCSFTKSIEVETDNKTEQGDEEDGGANEKSEDVSATPGIPKLLRRGNTEFKCDSIYESNLLRFRGIKQMSFNMYVM